MVKRMLWTGVLINSVLFVLLWMWRNSIVEFVAGAFFAMCIRALIGALEYPELLMQICTPGGEDLRWEAGGHHGVVLQLRGFNKRLGSPLKYLFQRASANRHGLSQYQSQCPTDGSHSLQLKTASRPCGG